MHDSVLREIGGAADGRVSDRFGGHRGNTAGGLCGPTSGNGAHRQRADDRPFQGESPRLHGPPSQPDDGGRNGGLAYGSGNGQTVGSVFASGGSGFASGFGVTEQRFCKVNIVMTKDVVSEVNYSGPTGGILTQASSAPSRSKTAYNSRRVLVLFSSARYRPPCPSPTTN
jgi:hypothetical protein